MNHTPPQKIEYGTFKSYLIGFILSVALTLIAYFLVVSQTIKGMALDSTVGILAILQAVLQLILFLNLTRKAKPRWNLTVFLFMILIVVILVLGSIWIMNNLNYNLMLP